MIVDDEILNLEAYKRLIPWEELNVSAVKTASSGFDAIEVIRNQRVDILVTDMKMPIMSGAELMRRTREIASDIKIIVISGYDDFEYARHAIEMNAAAYLLKPVENTELVESLKKVTAILDKECLEKLHKIEHGNSIPYIRDHLLIQLLNGYGNEQMLHLLKKQCGIALNPDQVFRSAFLEMDDYYRILKEKGKEQCDRVFKSICERLSSMMEDLRVGYCVRISDYRIGMILQGTLLSANELQKMISAIAEEFFLSVSVGTGSYVRSVYLLHDSSLEAAEALNYKMFLGRGRVIDFPSTLSEIKEISMDFEYRLSLLFSAAVRSRTDEIYTHTYKLFKFFRNMKDNQTIHHFTHHFVSKLEAYLDKYNENAVDIFGQKEVYPSSIFHCTTVEEIENWMRTILLKIADYFKDKKERRNKKIIRDIEKYVSENITKKINLKQVAEHFSFSPNYLGCIFKEATKENFSEYLIKKRLEEAHKMIVSTNYKIYEIADLVGYGNMKHFSKQFKEYFGAAPTEYRKEV